MAVEWLHLNIENRKRGELYSSRSPFSPFHFNEERPQHESQHLIYHPIPKKDSGLILHLNCGTFEGRTKVLFFPPMFVIAQGYSPPHVLSCYGDAPAAAAVVKRRSRPPFAVAATAAAAPPPECRAFSTNRTEGGDFPLSLFAQNGNITRPRLRLPLLPRLPDGKI